MITLKLNVDDINLILAALAQRPYVEVAQLIAHIQQQGQRQLDDSNNDPEGR